MTQTVTYDPTGADLVLTTRRPEDTEFVEGALFGAAEMGKVIVDDDTSALDIVGLKRVEAIETAAPAGDRRLYTGFVGPRPYRRSSQVGPVGAEAREIEIQLAELNTILSDHIVQGTGAAGGKRSREQAATRLRWLLESGFLDAEDRGKVIYPSVFMDAHDYRGEPGGAVLADIATVCKYDYTLLLDDEAETVPELFFDVFDRSTAYTTTAKISNAGDDDGTTIFAPDQDPSEELQRNPENVSSGDFHTWAKGNVYVRNEATATAFRDRDAATGSSTGKTAAQARIVARHWLADHAAEEDTVTVGVYANAADVNKFRRGHRVQAKLTYAPGLEDYAWCRIVTRRVTQPANHDLKYRIGLDLKPMTAAGAGGACTTEINQAHGTVTGHVEASAGVTWAHATWSCWPYSLPGTCDTPVSTIPINDPTKANDGDPTTYSWMDPQQLRTDGTATAYWESELDDTYTVCSMRGTSAVGSDSWQSMQPDKVEYWDGAAWQDAAGAFTYTPASPTPQYWIFTFAEPIATTKLRIGYTQAGVSVIAGLWDFLSGGRRVYDWLIYV